MSGERSKRSNNNEFQFGDYMHYRFFATFNKEEAGNSEEAREFVADYLNGNGFVSEGRWGGGHADWFVIGGRWSGELQCLTDAVWEAIKKSEKIETGDFGISVEETKKKRDELQKIWESLGGKGLNPYSRNSYEHDGYEDDAMIVTKEIYEKLLKEYEGSEDSEHHADLNYDAVSPDFIGKKWVVVVDYHN